MLRIIEPFHGAVLNGRHGRLQEGGLQITVAGECPPYGAITVNGAPAHAAGGRFEAPALLTERETEITAVYEGVYGRQEHRVRVVWDRHSFPRYRFSIDDNSFWLRDVARQQYASLFDCWYLKMLRDFHREYGTKFTVNTYFECQEEFGQPQFLLSDFPDRYRGEFEASAEWLGLAFHAYANRPDRPYQYASAAKLISDLELVEEQIVRIAGRQSLIPPTVIHWGMVQPAALPALHAHGVRALSGFFTRQANTYDVHYWLDDARAEYLCHHDALKDFASGIVFSRVDIVVNNTPVEQIEGKLAPLAADPAHAEIMDLFTHEQYFWPFYPVYLPDHPQRVDRALRWVTEHGYKPVFFHEGLLGADAGESA